MKSETDLSVLWKYNSLGTNILETHRFHSKRIKMKEYC